MGSRAGQMEPWTTAEGKPPPHSQRVSCDLIEAAGKLRRVAGDAARRRLLPSQAVAPASGSSQEAAGGLPTSADVGTRATIW
jgi:hypothetical protein